MKLGAYGEIAANGIFPWGVPRLANYHTVYVGMSLEGVFRRVLRKLPASDAIALAPQREKVIQILRKELLTEGVLAEEEGEGAVQRRGVAVSPQKHFSVSVGTEALTGIALVYVFVLLCSSIVAK